MNVQDGTDSSYDISQLIDSLACGEINPSDFAIKINQYSQTMTKNLFRDSLPKFSSNIRTKITDVFVRYFFNDKTYPSNDLWRFVDYKDFWIQLRTFHDYIYTRSMNFNDTVKFFEDNVSSSNNRPNLSYLEQRIIEQLDQTPHILNKDLAEQFRVSEKTISHLMGGLKDKGISLGSSVDYSALDSYEFFKLGNAYSTEEKSTLIQKYEFFPSFSMIYGISTEKIKDSSVYNVINKKILCNTHIFTHRISLKDWSNHPIKRRNSQIFNQRCVQSNFYITPVTKDYILQLVGNCETDFKRPNIKQIADNFDVSIRTLFRTKSKLKDMGIIRPKIILENEELMTILLISENELIEFYDKVPYIKSYEVQDSENAVRWMTFLSIFPTDFNFIYKKINKSIDVFQVVEKQVLIQDKDGTKNILQLNQKI